MSIRLSASARSVIATFRKRWRWLEKPVARRKAVLRAGFETPTEGDNRALARVYYGENHVKAMCALTDAQIAANLRPVCAFLGAQAAAGNKCSADELHELLAEEYVLFTPPDEYCWGLNPPDGGVDLGAEDLGIGMEAEVAKGADDDEALPLLGNFSARSYPGSGGYDDWYERTGGVSTCGILLKSTGESFSGHELRLLKQAVVDNVMSNGRSEGNGTLFLCAFSHAAQEDNQVVVSILIHGAVYVDQLVEGVAGMGGNAITKLAADILALDDNTRKELPPEFLVLVKDHSKKERPSPKEFKGKLTALLKARAGKDYEDANPVLTVEDALRPYLFNGRPYYHGRNSVVFYKDDEGAIG